MKKPTNKEFVTWLNSKGIHNAHNLCNPKDPFITYSNDKWHSGAYLHLKGFAFKKAKWEDHGALAFVLGSRQDLMAQAVEAGKKYLKPGDTFTNSPFSRFTLIPKSVKDEWFAKFLAEVSNENRT